MALEPYIDETLPASGVDPNATPIVGVDPSVAPGLVPPPTAPDAPVAPAVPQGLPVPTTRPSQVDDNLVGDKSYVTAPGTRTSDSSSKSVSTTGITPGGIKMEGAANRAASEPGVNVELQQIRDQQEKATKRFTDAATAEKTANEEVAKQQETYANKLSDWHKKQADIVQQYQGLEEGAMNAAKEMNAQFMSDYKEQLAGIRQLMAQDPDPTHDMTIGQSLGMTGAAFAQGFLAARGVHIDPMGAIDKWVNDSIQAHRSKIADAKDALNMSVNLHNIAREGARDEADYRMRLKGFAIEAVQSSINAQADMFNSAVAKANAAVANAKLDAASAKNLNDMEQKGLTDAHAVIKDDRQYKVERERLMIESQKLAEEQRHNRAMEGPKVVPSPTMLADPTNTKRVLVDGQGRVVPAEVAAKFATRLDTSNPTSPKLVDPQLPQGFHYEQRAAQPYMIRQGIPKEAEAKAVDRFTEEFGKYAPIQVLTNEVRELYAKNQEYVKNPGLLNRLAASAGKSVDVFKTEQQKEFEARRDELVNMLTKANNGTNSSDKEYQRHLEPLKGAGLGTSEVAFGTILDRIEDSNRKVLNEKLSADPNIIVAPANEGKTTAVFDPNTKSLGDAREKGTPGGKDPIAAAINEQAVERGSSTSISPAYDAYKGREVGEVPNAVLAVDTAAKVLALNGSASENGQVALDSLRQMATGRIGNHELDKDAVGYASHVLGMFDNTNGKPHPELSRQFTDHREGWADPDYYPVPD